MAGKLRGNELCLGDKVLQHSPPVPTCAHLPVFCPYCTLIVIFAFVFQPSPSFCQHHQTAAYTYTPPLIIAFLQRRRPTVTKQTDLVTIDRQPANVSSLVCIFHNAAAGPRSILIIVLLKTSKHQDIHQTIYLLPTYPRAASETSRPVRLNCQPAISQSSAPAGEVSHRCLTSTTLRISSR